MDIYDSILDTTFNEFSLCLHDLQNVWENNLKENFHNSNLVKHVLRKDEVHYSYKIICSMQLKTALLGYLGCTVK